MQFTYGSIVMEVVVWSLVYYFFFTMWLRSLVEGYLKKQAYFQQAMTRSGTTTKNAADEIILNLVFASHHIIGALVMLAGSYLGNADLWAHGLLFENGFELVDVFLVLFDRWPYGGGQVKVGFKVVKIFHHLPGLLLTPQLIMNDLHHSPHLQRVAAYLLLAGGIAFFFGAVIQTRDFNTQMNQATAMQVGICLFFIYARIWVYPISSMAFIEELQNSHTSEGLILGVKTGIGALGFFNIVIGLVVVEKTIRYVRKILPGGEKVNVDDGPAEKPVGKYD